MQITINLDGDAFYDDVTAELSQVFSRLTARMQMEDMSRPPARMTFPLRDSNGNTCGQVEIESDQPTTASRPTLRSLQDSLRAGVQVPADLSVSQRIARTVR